MAKKEQSKFHIIWCVDPFQKDPRIIAQFKNFFSSLPKSTALQIEPAFVVSPSNILLSVMAGSNDEHLLRECALKEINKIILKIGVKCQAPSILFESELGTSSATKRLCLFAKRRRASMILIGSRQVARPGLRGLGSFAQELSRSTQTPILSLPPGVNFQLPLKNFIYVSDFSKVSFDSFKHFCKVARLFNATIIVTHVFHTPTAWIARMGESFLPTPHSQCDSEARRFSLEIDKKRRQWQNQAQLLGVNADFYLEQRLGPLSDQILAATQQLKIHLIGLVTQTRTTASKIFGTTTQKIINKSEVPVWFARG